MQQYGSRQEQIPLSQPAGDTKTDTSHLGHKQGRSDELDNNYQEVRLINLHMLLAAPQFV